MCNGSMAMTPQPMTSTEVWSQKVELFCAKRGVVTRGQLDSLWESLELGATILDEHFARAEMAAELYAPVLAQLLVSNDTRRKIGCILLLDKVQRTAACPMPIRVTAGLCRQFIATTRSAQCAGYDECHLVLKAMLQRDAFFSPQLGKDVKELMCLEDWNPAVPVKEHSTSPSPNGDIRRLPLAMTQTPQLHALGSPESCGGNFSSPVFTNLSPLDANEYASFASPIDQMEF